MLLFDSCFVLALRIEGKAVRIQCLNQYRIQFESELGPEGGRTKVEDVYLGVGPEGI